MKAALSMLATFITSLLPVFMTILFGIFYYVGEPLIFSAAPPLHTIAEEISEHTIQPAPLAAELPLVVVFVVSRIENGFPSY